MEFARGLFSGISSNFKYKEQWQLLTESLNCLGGSEKTVEQWIDLKSGVKKSVNSRRKFINQTGEVVGVMYPAISIHWTEAGVEFKERPAVSLIRYKTLIIKIFWKLKNHLYR